MELPRGPSPTVDIIIELPGDRIVLIERKFAPLGRAIPGGFVDYGETAENAARREALEETGLVVELRALLGVYSDPRRDARRHTISMVYVATAASEPVAGDDAADAFSVPIDELQSAVYAFDHGQIIADYLEFRRSGRVTPLG